MAPFVSGWQFAVLASIIIAIIIKSLIDYTIKIWHLPPGPWGVPIFGYLPWTSNRSHETFQQLGKKYGGLFSIQLGSETAVVLNDWPTIKATIADHAKIFSGRPKTFMAKSSNDFKDIVFGEGPVWQMHKRVTLQCLRNLGVGKKTSEAKVMEIIHEIIDKLKEKNNQVVPMKFLFHKPIVKAIVRMIAGNYDSLPNKEIIHTVRSVIKGLVNDNPVAFLPWLRFLPPNGFGFWEFKKSNYKLLNINQKHIKDHIPHWKAGAENDFTDLYLTAINDYEAINSASKPPYNLKYAGTAIWNMYLGGVDTTNATCQWGFLYLACNPQVQIKVQAELDAVVGRQRLITSDDFPRLPYLEASIKEIHRISSIVPLSIPHAPTKDFEINGYTIPKGTTCLQNIYAVHHDPTLWGDPEVFRPERFLDNENKVLKPPYWMPFSFGPRVCVGQSLAEMELKYIFGSLLLNFTFSLPDDVTKPNFEPEVGLVIMPPEYSLHIKIRN